jgi:hypothetical protein
MIMALTNDTSASDSSVTISALSRKRIDILVLRMAGPAGRAMGASAARFP